MKAVFTHKPASIYDDKPEEHYQFPETYLRPAEGAVGDFILYYEPGRVGVHDRGRSGRRAYVAVAKVTGVRPDPARRNFFYADIDPSFLEPVTSDIPTLVLSGTYDPVTPTPGGEAVAEDLGATFVTFEGFGHGVWNESECGTAITLAFLTDPAAEVDVSQPRPQLVVKE